MRRLKDLYAELGVGLGPIPATKIPRLRRWKKTGLLAERVKSVFFTRLMLYPIGRLGAMRNWNRHGFRILMYHRFTGSPLEALQDSL